MTSQIEALLQARWRVEEERLEKLFAGLDLTPGPLFPCPVCGHSTPSWLEPDGAKRVLLTNIESEASSKGFSLQEVINLWRRKYTCRVDAAYEDTLPGAGTCTFEVMMTDDNQPNVCIVCASKIHEDRSKAII